MKRILIGEDGGSAIITSYDGGSGGGGVITDFESGREFDNTPQWIPIA